MPSAALLWGLQCAFLNPALALVLVSVQGASAAQVGWVLAVYNGSGSLGVAAAVEIPALLLGRLSRRFSDLGLLATGCASWIAYYVAMTFVSGPIPLICLQVLNAWFFAAVAGVGLALFQRIIPRPGLASGLYANTRRLGAIVSGPLIGFGSLTALGQSGVFAVCAALTVFALVLIGIVTRTNQARSHGGT